MKTPRSYSFNANIHQQENNVSFKDQLPLNKETYYDPWAIDRVGRFILGLKIVFVALAIIFGSKLWAVFLIVAGLNLIVTSITNKCLFNKMLKSFGFKEREEIYESDGQIKIKK